jgi:hypothetical protein
MGEQRLSFADRVRALFARPRLLHVSHAHALAVPGGRTPVRVVARGVGRLTIGDTVRFIGGAVDDVFFAPAAKNIEVRFEGLFGRAERRATVKHLLPDGPVRIVVTDAPLAHVDERARPIVLKPKSAQALERAPLTPAVDLPTVRPRRPRRISLPRETP